MTLTYRAPRPRFRSALALVTGTISAAMVSFAIAPTPSIAQTYNDSDAFDDVRQGNERDPLLGGSDIDMMDLIHRANLGGGRSIAEFISSQSAQIESAASDFRALQLQRLYQNSVIDTPSAISLDLSE